MAMMKIEYFSQVLDMDQTVNVLYPDENRVSEPNCKDIPVLYLLHGMGGGANSWLKHTALARLVRNTNLIVVMPDTHNGWYTNTTYGYAYFDAIAKELPRLLKRFFPNMSDKREKNFIAGLSMGGYGAFKLALVTNRFSYAASLSGALDFEVIEENVEELGSTAYWQGIFGDITHLKNHPESLKELAKQSDKQTKLYAWCGQEDFLYPANNYASEWLTREGFDLTYKQDHGKHEWYYWDKQLEVLLKWLPIDFELEERLS